MKPPRVFISYSHDSADYKRWVLNFATTLRQRGVDAVLDQWDLKPGDDLPHFMETELAQCEYAIMICTERYVDKANSGEGGGGYEKMIMTAGLLKRIGSNKVIPIVRQQSTPRLPTFLGSKVYINFSRDEDEEYSLDELLRTLLDAPLFEKPEIGSSPFKPLRQSAPDRVSDGLKEVMKALALAFEKSDDEYMFLKFILNKTDMHRLTFDRYLNEAVNRGLVDRDILDRCHVTPDGIEYLIAHGIISA
jgi:hypothetical protein